MILSGKFHNRRAVGKPKTRWEYVIQRGTVQMPEIRERRRQDIGEWRCHLRVVGAQKEV